MPAKFLHAIVFHCVARSRWQSCELAQYSDDNGRRQTHKSAWNPHWTCNNGCNEYDHKCEEKEKSDPAEDGQMKQHFKYVE